jgi:hypothetical protein
MSLLSCLDIDPEAAGPLTSLFRPLVSAHAAIVRRSWFDNSVFTGSMLFDHALGLSAQLSGGLVYVDDAVVNHRIHGGNQMNSHSIPPESEYQLRSDRTPAFLHDHRPVEQIGIDPAGHGECVQAGVGGMSLHMVPAADLHHRCRTQAGGGPDRPAGRPVDIPGRHRLLQKAHPIGDEATIILRQSRTFISPICLSNRRMTPFAWTLAAPNVDADHRQAPKRGAAQKKGRSKATRVSFRRGCLKGLIVVHRSIVMCNP